MSDLTATNCGCAEERCGCGGFSPGFGCGNTMGNNSCSCILWIIILMCLCGNNNTCGSSFNSGGDCCWLIIVLLLCGGIGNC